VPARNALLADVVPAVYGRAYGFERMMDNLGAIAGPLLALGLVAALGVRTAIGLSAIPGLLAAVAIIYAIRRTPVPHARHKQPLRIRIRPVLHGKLGPLIAAIGCYEAGNAAATLLILRATQLLTPGHGSKTATTLALSLYVLYNLTATLASLPAGRASDRLGSNGPAKVLAAGVALSAAAYAGFAATTANLPCLALPFAAAGVATGLTETAENSAVAALAPARLRGSAFGLLATVQAAGNLAASAVAGGAVDRNLPSRGLHLSRSMDPAGPGRPHAGRPAAGFQLVSPRTQQ
jgi:MFS family permease